MGLDSLDLGYSGSIDEFVINIYISFVKASR